MKTNFYGPVKEGTLIREVNTNIHMLSNDDLNPFLSNIRITTDPIDVSPDSDYGFTIEINDEQSPNGI